MNNKSWYNLAAFLRATKLRWNGGVQASASLGGALAFYLLVGTAPACANEAPAWMHALVNVPLPAHDEKTDAALLYSEKTVTVQSADRIKTQVRVAYKILRRG